ncbi:flotillin family protein [Nonomuraea aurantiaca]|uniref:flotillin family protein n=1 Tax=Nonomuraea aurantiaca TaxID=2878562 RepID=UPI001CDA5416|nr:flotillin family protein [Nonomuraea aurantiaca]MCA2227648.1 flotillin family protein [Nonomuraea aurantiaca]
MDLVLTGVIVALALVAIVAFKLIWRVAEPNEAIIISGLGARGRETLGFKIVTGKGALVVPGFQTARRISLDSRVSPLEVNCVTKQGIPVHVRGVVIYKVGDDFASVANAARRFLDQQKTVDDKTHQLFSGHLRSIIGNLTVEDLIINRDALTNEIRTSSSDEMSKLGLIVDSLQIQEIEDATGYIVNLGRPHAAAVSALARTAEAQRDQEANSAEQEAQIKKSAAIREARIQQAGYQAEMDRAAAKAKQAGPLAEATARQEVVVQQTTAAELEAVLAEKRLEGEVRRPADARAYEQVTIAEAERRASVARAQAEAEGIRLRGEAEAEATRLRGMAEADAARAKGLAQADAIKARADALASNQEAVVAQQLAERWPEVVEAGAKAFGNVEHMVVLNGAQGVEEMLAKALTLGGAGLGLARTLLNRPASETPVAPAPTPNGASSEVVRESPELRE